jgi:hypothetical protein
MVPPVSAVPSNSGINETAKRMKFNAIATRYDQIDVAKKKRGNDLGFLLETSIRIT